MLLNMPRAVVARKQGSWHAMIYKQLQAIGPAYWVLIPCMENSLGMGKCGETWP